MNRPVKSNWPKGADVSDAGVDVKELAAEPEGVGARFQAMDSRRLKLRGVWNWGCDVVRPMRRGVKPLKLKTGRPPQMAGCGRSVLEADIELRPGTGRPEVGRELEIVAAPWRSRRGLRRRATER